jgi:uncharacterized protein
VMLIDGQKTDTPLRLDTVGKNQFKGLLVLDRWMVEPSLNDLVTEQGPDMGNPRFYAVTADAPALPRMKVHYSRCLRLEGIRLPYYQRMMENLWGISVLERLYDRMLAFDSATTGMAQLIYKAYLRIYKLKGMREAVAAGGPAMQGVVAQIQFMSQFQTIEGVTLLDGEDDVGALTQPSFSGLSDAMIQLGQQISGSLQIPLVRLFGQSPVGMNATGESDLRMYYDGIKQQQVKTLLVPLTRIYRAMAQSENIKLPEGFGLEFRSLWILSDEAKAAIGQQDQATVMGAYNSGAISQEIALKELKQLSKVSGRFTNVTEDDIKAANDVAGATMEAESHELTMKQGIKSLTEEPEAEGGKPNGKAKSSQAAA